MSLPDNFVIVDGLLTVEAILQPSWLIRRRVDENSMTSPFVWVATIAQAEIGYEIKGYLAKDEYPMVLSERRAMKRIVSQLGFSSGGYGRADKNGAERVSHAFEQGGKIAQKSGD
ncbi:hypothetical protein SAMN05216428_10163 [Nitrosospira sp. Nsp11]|uniref:hypothetical protein n=1 Tax=Nitrosospira sp. Nsp11 TaxID=1855338 RepID=UPI00091239DE|nr:hypothetical protein [Nitrosospira sp. Nsp11]SHL09740.1 hypothetical protein SAMN05216428_10163 [Nitrosospira sp. Nsp11]